MSTVEVDQARWDALTKAENLFNSLLEDPKSGMSVKKMIKEKYPTARVPDLDLIEQVTAPYDAALAAANARADALEARFNEMQQGQEVSKAEAKLTDDLNKVRAKHGFTDEGMAKVVEAMRERNLAHDPEAAAALIAAQMPKAAPTSARSAYTSPQIDIYGMQSDKKTADFEKLHTHPWAFFEDTVGDVLQEFADAGQ